MRTLRVLAARWSLRSMNRKRPWDVWGDFSECSSSLPSSGLQLVTHPLQTLLGCLRPAGFVQTPPQRLVIGDKDAGAEVAHERHLGELVAFFRGTHLKDHAFLHQKMGSGVAVRLLQNVVIKIFDCFPTR